MRKFKVGDRVRVIHPPKESIEMSELRYHNVGDIGIILSVGERSSGRRKGAQKCKLDLATAHWIDEICLELVHPDTGLGKSTWDDVIVWRPKELVNA